jgi:uncharacterized protein YkwD
LNDAIDRVGYPIKSSASLYLKGPTDDAAIREVIEDRYCTAVNNPLFTEVGVYRSNNETWIVLATRAEQPAVEDSAAVAARVLELVNAARTKPRRCGRRRLEAAPALTLSPALTEAASGHARDMAQHGSFDHRGSDGSQPAERVSRAGYRWRATGENIAAGQSSADTVVTAWLESPGHCANIMGPQFTQMGVAFAPAASGNTGIYLGAGICRAAMTATAVPLARPPGAIASTHWSYHSFHGALFCSPSRIFRRFERSPHAKCTATFPAYRQCAVAAVAVGEPSSQSCAFRCSRRRRRRPVVMDIHDRGCELR